MNAQEYRSILGQLPIKSPTPVDMALVCPHLTKEEAVIAFTTGKGYVACPPLRVRHGFQVLSYQNEWVEEIKDWKDIDGKQTRVVVGRKNHPARISSSFASRTRKSYADKKSHGDIFSEYVHMGKAMKFAEDNWGNELVLDNWNCVVNFYIQDPTDLVNDRYHTDYPRTKAVLGVTLNRDLNKILNDNSKPESELFNDAVVQMAVDHFVLMELRGERGSYTMFNCAHCGGGLSLNRCNGCGFRFRDDHCRCGWDTPLSQKMVEFLQQNGHHFTIDPKIAQEKELEQWESWHPKKKSS